MGKSVENPSPVELKTSSEMLGSKEFQIGNHQDSTTLESSDALECCTGHVAEIILIFSGKFRFNIE